MKHIIFLDFDGVITSESYTRQCIFEYKQENLFGLDWFDPNCVNILKQIIEKTDAKIIVSSSWRELGIVKLQYLWQKLNMPGEVIDTAPIWVLTKREAILQWLKDNSCYSYVIIDDEDLKLEHQYKTNTRTGLTEKDAAEIINILNVD